MGNFSSEPFHQGFWWLCSAVGKQWEIFHVQCSGKFFTVCTNSGNFFPLHISCGKFWWEKIWWESSGIFPTTHLNSGKLHFPPSLFPTFIFSGKLVGKLNFPRNFPFLPLNLQWEIVGFLVVITWIFFLKSNYFINLMRVTFVENLKKFVLF